MENKRTKLGVLFADLAKDSFKWLLVFLLSVGLIGSASYLLFDAPAKNNAVRRIQSDLEFKQEEANASLEMSKIADNGWFGKNPDYFVVYDALTELLKANPRADLSVSLQNNFPIWADNALADLSGERGRISGYIFADMYYKAQQDSILSMYDRFITAVTWERTTVLNWANDSIEKRVSNVRAIGDAEGQFRSSIREGGTIDNQTQQTNRIIRSLKQTRDESETEIQALTIRSYFAALGIIIGALVILLLISSFLYSLRRPA